MLTPLIVYAFFMRYVLHEASHFTGCIKYSLWFLKSALLCTILFSATYLIPQRWRWLAILFTLGLSQILLIYNTKYMYPCFLGGALLRNNTDWFMAKRKSITLAAGIIWFIMVLFFNQYFWSYISLDTQNFLPVETMIDPNWWFIVAYRTIIGLAGSLMFFGLFEALAARGFHQTFMGRILNKVGQETLWIYVLQTGILEVYLARMLNFDAVHPLVFYTLVVPLVSLGVLAISMLIIGITRRAITFSKSYLTRQFT